MQLLRADAQSTVVSGTAKEKREVLASAEQMVKEVLANQSVDGRARALLKKMLAIATAVIEGRPEPTDAELRKLEKGWWEFWK